MCALVLLCACVCVFMCAHVVVFMWLWCIYVYLLDGDKGGTVFRVLTHSPAATMNFAVEIDEEIDEEPVAASVGTLNPQSGLQSALQECYCCFVIVGSGGVTLRGGIVQPSRCESEFPGSLYGETDRYT